MRLLKITCFLLFFLITVLAKAQYFSTGDDPASIKWRELRTENFQLIYPEEYEVKAQHVAQIFEKVYEYGYKTLDHPPRKISIILHTHSINSNGLVAWSPKRVELFPTPNQRIYAEPWIEQLAVHEFRHVVQMDKIQTELPTLLKIIFGEQAAAAAVGLYLPFWFLEGDAVMTETALTHSGRGRTASFLMENKALAVEKGIFSYDKLSLGSYNEFIPNRYKFGYWFAGGVRQKYGAQVWSDVLTGIGKKPLSFNPLNKVLKKETGKNKEALFKEIFNEYLEEWKNEAESITETPNQQISSPNKIFTNYKYISAISDTSLIAYKTSRSDIGRIVQITNGNESVIFTPGNVADESLSQTDNLLIWSEIRPNVRWEHASRSVVVIYNTSLRQTTVIHTENNLLSPVISPDLDKFAGIETDFMNNYFLSIYELSSGKLIKRYSTETNDYFLTPVWNDSGDKIYFIGLSEQGKYIGELDLKTEEISAITEPVFYDIKNPDYYKGNLYFTSSKTGIDNIFCLNIESGEITQCTSVLFGANYASTSDNYLYFSDYTSNGYHVASLSKEKMLNKPAENIEIKKYELAETLSQQEGETINFTDQDTVHFPTKPYRKLAHLFNFHSWAPAYMNINNYEIKPGVSFLSQNKLGTASTNIGYEYNTTEEVGKYRAEFEYSGFFPVISAQIGYGKRKARYLEITEFHDHMGSIIRRDTTINSYEWNELNLDLDVRIPLYFSSGKYNQLIQPEIKYSYVNTYLKQNIPSSNLNPGYYHYVLYRLFFQNTIRKSEMDIVPDWGQIIDIKFRNSPQNGWLGGKNNWSIGNMTTVQTYLYFPGFKMNHGIKVYNAFQKKENNKDLTFKDAIKYPRGFHSFNNDEMYSFGIDYIMPLCYPDLSLGRFFYLKRLRTSLFYDYAKLSSHISGNNNGPATSYERELKSYGAEVIGDGNVLRITAPVSIGFRGAYMPDYEDISFEFLFTIDFTSL